MLIYLQLQPVERSIKFISQNKSLKYILYLPLKALTFTSKIR
jgi:hypothetical protein